jgi:preprotein translocase SecF subunit
VEFFHETRVDFLRWRRTAVAASAACILAGLVSLALKGGPAYGIYGIDFLGGTEIQFEFREPKDVAAVRGALAELRLANAEIKQFGSDREFLARFHDSGASGDLSHDVLEALARTFPGDPPEHRATSAIGPRIGAELRTSALWSILVSLILLLTYISARFEFVFAVGAVLALVHDVLITLGLFSFLDLEIELSVVAAFLTLIGYSLNDTIVVLDRVRENLKLRRGGTSIAEVINRSINQTLSRTVLTGLTTLIVVVILYAMGGPALRNFSFCLIVGVIVGTYSSIYIAAPAIVEWYDRRHRGRKARARSRPSRLEEADAL